MKALFGMVGLLVVLAIVGLIAARQLKSGAVAGGATAIAVGAHAASGLDAAPGMTVQQTSQNAQQKVRDDVTRALEQGAAARASGPDQ